MARMPEYDREKLIKAFGYDYRHKRLWRKSPDATFKPQSMLTFSELKEKGKLFFRQALLEIIFGEYQASLDFPNDMPIEARKRMIEFLEKDLRENLKWGFLYLKTKTETGVKKPDPLLNIPHSEPYEFIKSFEQYCEKEILSKFSEWEARLKVAGFPIETEFSKQRLQKSIYASVALYLVIHKLDFPESWPEVEKSQSTSREIILDGDKIEKMSENHPPQGIGPKDWQLYCYCETPRRLDEIRKKMSYPHRSKAHTMAIQRLENNNYFIDYAKLTKLYQSRK